MQNLSKNTPHPYCRATSTLHRPRACSSTINRARHCICRIRLICRFVRRFILAAFSTKTYALAPHLRFGFGRSWTLAMAGTRRLLNNPPVQERGRRTGEWLQGNEHMRAGQAGLGTISLQYRVYSTVQKNSNRAAMCAGPAVLTVCDNGVFIFHLLCWQMHV